MSYKAPDELEFLMKEFGLNSQHNPPDGVYSYVRSYDHDRQLIFSHSTAIPKSIDVLLVDSGTTVIEHYQEDILSIEFLGWGEEQIIRVGFESDLEIDLRISYAPSPKIFFSQWNAGN